MGSCSDKEAEANKKQLKDKTPRDDLNQIAREEEAETRRILDANKHQCEVDQAAAGAEIPEATIPKKQGVADEKGVDEKEAESANVEAFRPWFRVRTALLGRASPSSVLARLSENLLRFMLFSKISPHGLSLFEEALYEEALNSVNPMPVQRVLQLLRTHSQLLGAARVARTLPGVAAQVAANEKETFIRELMSVQYLNENEHDMQWVYAVADENDDDAVRTSFYLPELSAELLPLLAAYGPGEGFSVQQRVEWLLLLDMLITKPLSILGLGRLGDAGHAERVRRQLEACLSQMDIRQFCICLFATAECLALDGHPTPSGLLLPLFSCPNPNHLMGNETIQFKIQWGYLGLPPNDMKSPEKRPTLTSQLLGDNTVAVVGMKELPLQQSLDGEKKELQAVFGCHYPGGKDLAVNARSGSPREPYVTHQFVLLNLEDRQKMMDEFEITAENWPLLVAVYYRTKLLLPVELHANDLDTVTKLATFISVALFRVTANSTASIRSELAAVRETALRALQLPIDIRENSTSMYQQIAQCGVPTIWLLLEVSVLICVRGVS